MEIWEDIIGYDGDYQVSNYGRVKSFKGRTERILKPGLGGKHSPYYFVSLCKDGVSKMERINRLVGIHFVDNPDNLPVVHHKDNNKLNNHYSNLEWNTHSNNTIHAFESGLGNMSFSPRKVIQLDKQGNFIREYESLSEAARLNNICSHTNISKVCRSERKSSGGYVWKYKNN